MSELPIGTVTFLFTDIEGSTGLLKRLGRDAYESVLAEQARILRAAFAAHGGQVVDTQGDSFFASFRTARDAVSAAVDAQRALAAADWPAPVRVRMGLHSAEPKASGERYVGIGVHRAARVGGVAHGGQVLLSDATRALVEDDLPKGVFLRDLGSYRLKDIDRPERISQLASEGLQAVFPPLRAGQPGRRLPTSRRGRFALTCAAIVIVGVAATGVLLASGSSSSAPIHLAANSLAAIDPKTGRAVADVKLGFAPTGVVAGGDEVWVLDAADRTVTEIDATSLRVRRSFGLERSPFNQWASGTKDWVALSGAVEMVDSGSGTASAIPLWSPSSAGLNGSSCVPAVTGMGGTVLISQGRDLVMLDARSGSRPRRLELPAATGLGPACYAFRYLGGRLLAARDPDSAAGWVDPATGTFTPIVSGFPGLGGPQGCCWTTGLGSLWIGKGDSITRVDAGSGQVVSKTPIGGRSGALVVDPGGVVWALDLPDESLVSIDPAASQGVTRRIRLQHFPSSDAQGVAAGHGRIWVALQSP